MYHKISAAPRREGTQSARRCENNVAKLVWRYNVIGARAQTVVWLENYSGGTMCKKKNVAGSSDMTPKLSAFGICGFLVGSTWNNTEPPTLSQLSSLSC